MGRLRKRVPSASRDSISGQRLLKGFHAPQKDTSKRAKKRAGLNNYNEDKKKEDQ